MVGRRSISISVPTWPGSATQVETASDDGAWISAWPYDDALEVDLYGFVDQEAEVCPIRWQPSGVRSVAVTQSPCRGGNDQTSSAW